MSEMRFTEDHEWILLEDDDIATIGITDYAQEQLGELVYVELPEVGHELTQGSEAATIESVKAAGEVKAPVTGTVVDVNETLADEPERVNNDPTGDGWFLKLKVDDPAQLEQLMDEETYEAFIKELD